MPNLMAMLMLILAVLTGDDGKRERVAIDLLTQGGVQATLEGKRGDDGWQLLAKRQGKVVLELGVLPDKEDPWVVTLLRGGQRFTFDLRHFGKRVEALAEDGDLVVPYPKPGGDVPPRNIRLSRRGGMVYVSAPGEKTIVVGRTVR